MDIKMKDYNTLDFKQLQEEHYIELIESGQIRESEKVYQTLVKYKYIAGDSNVRNWVKFRLQNIYLELILRKEFGSYKEYSYLLFDPDRCQEARNIYSIIYKVQFRLEYGDIGIKKWVAYDVHGKKLEPDCMISFWTSFRAKVEFYFERLFQSKSKLTDKYGYEFCLMFGGIRKYYNLHYGFSKEELKKHYQEVECPYKYYMDALYNGYNKFMQKELERERLEWLLLISEDEELMIFSNPYLEELAYSTHVFTKSFSLVPLGYNKKRYRVSKDYIDLTLKNMQNQWGNDWLEEYVDKYHYHDFCVIKEDEPEVPLLANHDFYGASIPNSEAELDKCIKNMLEKANKRGNTIATVINNNIKK
jgi:hypothetical protein